ncbi:hypothetical protein TUM4438_10520 [Shewanella sairae]|uniref:Uncharacterized protein n=1 Tax=Shewanella sairae TaxID=190310 RepID=A0ABQ4P5S3_9GAMM|nr:hypothetical protein [Shewanella sairae]MCL1130485.1 hypothetical protein [Shewanella sairae]GIU42895.1 hypothetical protein TUM4438_10520 [Shewanella sairae]
MEVKHRLVQIVKVIGKLTVIIVISGTICAAALYTTIIPLQNELSAIKQENLQFKTKLSQHDVDIGNLQTSVNSLTGAAERLQSAVDLLKESRTNTQLKLDTLDKQNQSSNEMALFYKKQIADLNAKIVRLSERAKQVKRLATTQPKQLSKKNKSLSPTVPVKTPFTLHSIQMRGAALVAVVSPLNANSLADVTLIKTNDNYLGWHVTSISNNTVKFHKANQTIALQVSA